MATDTAVREHLIWLLEGGHAHTKFDEVVANFPKERVGVRPQGVPYSAWELLEHMRLAQWDILEFSRDPDHKSPKFPDGYWPAKPEPPDEKAWERSVNGFWQDLNSMCALVADDATDLYARIPHGEGQTILREALLTADHNAYHLGQLVLLRRLLGAWNAGS